MLRGAPGSGKSTWVEENKLTPYTLSADGIRQMISGLVYDNTGKQVISQQHDGEVWRLLMKCLEDRMDRGEFVVVDATHYRAALLQQYKKLISKYRYRAYVVDFTDVDEATAQKRNRWRDGYKFVPPEAIHKMYTVFNSDYKEVSNRFNVITRKEAVDMLYRDMLFDYDGYRKVVVFGDIHGCYEPLKRYFDDHVLDEDVAYIFTGDYLDRGIQNREVAEFLLSVKDRKNVLLLEGNHERWLRMYSEGEDVRYTDEERNMLRKYVGREFWDGVSKHQIRNRGFREKTAPQLEGLSKKDLRQLCRRMGQMAYIGFRGKRYFISHGGCPMLPSLFVPACQYIDGTGEYEDVDALYENWLKNTDEKEILVHAHRNVFHYPAKINDRCYNLCSDIEYGKPLRIMEITDAGIEVLEYNNPVYDKAMAERRLQDDLTKELPATENELIAQLNATNLVEKKRQPNGAISYNFTRTAFSDARWNHLTCTARGLFIKDDKIVARSYNKFFNWGERNNTTDKGLHETLKFPVTAYGKENGFLALVASMDGKLKVCSKSSMTGEYAGYIRNMIDAQWTDELKEKVRRYSEEHDSTFVFECIETERDPHIVRYGRSRLVLLDIVKNSFAYENLPYDGLVKVAKEFGLECKEKKRVFKDWSELWDYYKSVKASFDAYRPFEEGVVLVDANNFMVKLKTPAYLWWKKKRSILQSLQAGHTVKPVYGIPADIKVFGLMNRLKDEGKLDGMSILDVQDIFWKENKDGDGE